MKFVSMIAGIAAGVGLLAGSGAAEAQKVNMALNAATSGGYVAYITKDKGFFKEFGVDVEFIKVATPAAGTSAVASGDADLAVFGMSAGFFNLAGNGDFVIIAGATEEAKGFIGQAYIASNAAYAAGLKSLADFAGKRVGIGSRGATGEYGLYLLTEKAKVPYASYTLVSLGGDANLMSAIKAGSVDVGVTGSGTLALATEKAGDGKVIALTGNEWPGMSSNVLFTSPKTIAAKRDLMVRFLKGYLKGAALYANTFKRDDKGEFANKAVADELLGIIAKNNGMQAESIKEGLPFVPADLRFNADEAKSQIRVWKALNSLDAKVSEQGNYVDLSLLEAAKK